MAVEEPELLAAVHRIEGVVDVEDDALGHLLERRAVEVHQGGRHAQQGANVGHVLQPGDRRLRGEMVVGRRDPLRHLEHRILAKAGRIVAVLVAGRDHHHAETDHVGQRMGDQIGIARVRDAPCQPLRNAKPALDLAQHQHAGVRRQRTAVETGLHGAPCDR